MPFYKSHNLIDQIRLGERLPWLFPSILRSDLSSLETLEGNSKRSKFKISTQFDRKSLSKLQSACISACFSYETSISQVDSDSISLFCARDKTNKHLSLSTRVVIETRLEDENSLNDIGY